MYKLALKLNKKIIKLGGWLLRA